MEFTDKDREFIVKLAKSIEDYKKSFEGRLANVEAALDVKNDGNVISPIQPKPSKKKALTNSKFSEDIPFGDDIADEGSSIQIVFKHGEEDIMKHRILVESLYATLKELCEKNDIEKLLIRIDETQ